MGGMEEKERKEDMIPVLTEFMIQVWQETTKRFCKMGSELLQETWMLWAKITEGNRSLGFFTGET